MIPRPFAPPQLIPLVPASPLIPNQNLPPSPAFSQGNVLSQVAPQFNPRLTESIPQVNPPAQYAPLIPTPPQTTTTSWKIPLNGPGVTLPQQVNHPPIPQVNQNPLVPESKQNQSFFNPSLSNFTEENKIGQKFSLEQVKSNSNLPLNPNLQGNLGGMNLNTMNCPPPLTSTPSQKRSLNPVIKFANPVPQSPPINIPPSPGFVPPRTSVINPAVPGFVPPPTSVINPAVPGFFPPSTSIYNPPPSPGYFPSPSSIFNPPPVPQSRREFQGDYEPINIVFSKDLHKKIEEKYQEKIERNGLKLIISHANNDTTIKMETELKELLKKYTFDSNAKWAFLENDGSYKYYTEECNSIIENKYKSVYYELSLPSYKDFSENAVIVIQGPTYIVEFARIGGVHRQKRKNDEGYSIRAVKRQANGEDLNQNFFRNYRWLWWHESNQFLDYEPDANYLIECCWQEYRENNVKSIALIQGSNSKTYKIDFSNYTQYNELTNYDRPIRRETIS
jgi:hypothetical protein